MTKDKRRIEELQKEVREQLDSVGTWQRAWAEAEKEAKKLSDELAKQKERYAQLLERHIDLMEKVVWNDEQRKAD